MTLPWLPKSRLAVGSSSTTTRGSCAKAQGVAVYTVGFSVASDPIDAGGLDLLKKCATSSDMAYVANDSTQFLAAFDEIARKIGALRLTQ